MTNPRHLSLTACATIETIALVVVIAEAITNTTECAAMLEEIDGMTTTSSGIRIEVLPKAYVSVIGNQKKLEAVVSASRV